MHRHFRLFFSPLSLSFLVFPHLFAFSAPLNIHSICLTLISLSPFPLLHCCSLSRCVWLWQALKIKPLGGLDYTKCFALQFQSAFDYWKVHQCIDFEGHVFNKARGWNTKIKWIQRFGMTDKGNYIQASWRHRLPWSKYDKAAEWMNEMNKRYESHIWEDEFTTQALRSGQDAT